MTIHEVAISELKPYEKNAKKHPEKQVEIIANSLREFGFKQPVVADKDGVIVAGHGRVLAAKKLGMETVPVLYADDLTEDQIKAFRLADNKTAESEWDFELLNFELDDIEMDMEQFGFEMEEDPDEKEIVEDDIPEEEEIETKCKPGDVWQIGNHRLICGDSTDVTAIDRLMDGVKADMVFTDPPYGMNLDTDYSKMNGDEGHGKKYDKGFVDDFHSEMIDAIMLMNAKETFIWGADYFAELIPNRNSGSWFVWDKRENELTGANVDKRFGSMFELCWSKEKHKREIFRFMWAGMMKQKDVDDKRYHPTQKPIKLAGWFLDRYSKEGQNIVDLFGGSGSTLIACEQLNRICYICELDPHYCDVILQRYVNFVGSDKEVYLIKENGERVPYSEVK